MTSPSSSIANDPNCPIKGLPSIRFDMRLSREGEADRTSGRVGADPAAIMRAAKGGNGQAHAAGSAADLTCERCRCKLSRNLTCRVRDRSTTRQRKSGCDVCLSRQENVEPDTNLEQIPSYPQQSGEDPSAGRTSNKHWEDR